MEIKNWSWSREKSLLLIEIIVPLLIMAFVLAGIMVTFMKYVK